MTITTIIFDYGCVLSTPPSLEDYNPLRKMVGVDQAEFQQLYWRQRDAYDVDALDTLAYWQDLGRAVGADYSLAQVQALADLDIKVWERTDPVMLKWNGLLRAKGFKTAILSNMSRGIGDYLRRTAGWLKDFDYLCFSGEIQTGKPGAAIFHACLAGVGEPPDRTLFIDDREVNITAGRAIGMHGIVFHSVEQLQSDLEPYGLADSLAEARAHVR